jgi:hypothetical protein
MQIPKNCCASACNGETVANCSKAKYSNFEVQNEQSDEIEE